MKLFVSLWDGFTLSLFLSPSHIFLRCMIQYSRRSMGYAGEESRKLLLCVFPSHVRGHFSSSSPLCSWYTVPLNRTGEWREECVCCHLTLFLRIFLEHLAMELTMFTYRVRRNSKLHERQRLRYELWLSCGLCPWSSMPRNVILSACPMCNNLSQTTPSHTV